MNALVPQNFAPVSNKFTSQPADHNLGAGVQAGFPIMRIKGKTWTVSHNGNSTTLMRPDGDGPRNSIEVVILNASNYVSKMWYENGYVEGANAAPDCFSPNGVTPNPGSKKKQSNACASCPRNQWGARISPSGKPAKECSDSKRVAIVPLEDIANEAFGGPMLLRVPANSLKALHGFGAHMQAMGYPYYSIGTRLSFDPSEAYPKLVLSAIRPLTDEEAELVLRLRNDHQVTTILAEGSENALAPPAPGGAPTAPSQLFEQPPDAPKVTPKVTAPKPVPTPAPVQQVAAAPSDFEKSLDEQLNLLLPE